jgi:uncharacterized membrane protein
MSGLRRVLPSVAAALGVAAALLVATDSDSSLRPLVVVPFLLAGPGTAIVRLLRLGDRLEELMLAIAVSVSLGVLLALAMLYASVWSATAGVSILAAVTVLAWAADLLRTFTQRRRRHRASRGHAVGG